ncbi:Sua5/YciO/YrdC/YwlC family protein [Pseudoxanthomonas dokdonensis]|uniref:Threonylcarbamoyl-AMP synthase n=1 Tax=Pseudoxanthomonas dokdonensis TaxID=344882 RepID=A0A0R0CWE9_9GAMM|nr:Sua5/YciO/YrdC/YwlC family protein [Pseudoxanthomonas dokdonensis]KRG69352.1 tRNA threonylcarbamoyladenosine biosynthesis protein RimN [Pseudoxanthomonas dokdonensis]
MKTELDIASAAALLHGGGVLAYPTEAVWGLGCDPLNQRSVERLLAIKQRPVEKGLILIAASHSQLRELVDFDALPAPRLSEVRASWPGPHTWVVPASRQTPGWITGQHASVAVRVSAHPTVVALCQAFGAPLVSTSANLSGQPAVASRELLDPQLQSLLDGIVPGHTGELTRPTPIRDALSGLQLRE